MAGSITMKATVSRKRNVGQVIVRNSPEAERFAYKIARRIADDAIAIFITANRKDNEWRLSETTPPKYIASFRLAWHRELLRYTITNIDPGWHFVEYGAHAGGKTFVLRYRPMAKALDLAAARRDL